MVNRGRPNHQPTPSARIRAAKQGLFRSRAAQPSGFTLLELLIVVALVGILAAAAVPAMQPSIHDRLQGAARLLAVDLGAARDLSVARGSPHRLTFDLTQNRYTLTHSGTNTAFNTLPATPFRSPYDTATSQVTDLDELPGWRAGSIAILVARREGSLSAPVTFVEFDSLGQTSISDDTVIWLGAGAGSARRYLTVRVNATTGLPSVETFGATGPPTN